MLTLVVDSGGGSELNYELAKQVISVGAASANDVVIRSPGVAPRHLTIQRNGDVVTFLGQNRQVVTLNGERRSRGVLRPGDRIRIGAATVELRAMGSEAVITEDRSTSPPAKAKAAAPDVKKTNVAQRRSEVVLYSEPAQVAEARGHLVDLLRNSVRGDLVPSLETFFARFFAGRQAAVAVLDENGEFQTLAAQWTQELPRLPARTFAELATEGRFALLRLGSREFLIYPIDRGDHGEMAYLLLQTSEEERDNDELVAAELTRSLAVFWDRLERSTAVLGAWETASRKVLDERLPGTSQATIALRDGMIGAARSPHPVLISGGPGSGRSWVARAIASLHPVAEPAMEIVRAEAAGDAEFRSRLFGSTAETGIEGVVERHGRGTVLLLRDIHLLELATQKELAETIRRDLDSDFGPALRWMATTAPDCVSLVNEGDFDADLFQLFHRHLLGVPCLSDRREDLSLLIIRLLDSAAAEQVKKIRGIELGTLSSLLSHSFDGEVAELLGEVRRLVSATPSNDVVRGSVPAVLRAGGGAAAGDSAENSASALLAIDDLKTVVPAVERLIIDRVLRRTLGNQSKAARHLNLSRGALISKMKEYEISDYRYLRRRD